jgi:hypothetical protein
MEAALVGLIPAALSARGFRTDMYKAAATDAGGRFVIPNLPPGDYKAFAWTDIDKSALMDQDFMRLHEDSGVRVRIGEGERPSLQLTATSLQ